MVVDVVMDLALDYADLNRIDPAPNCVLRGEYYIQLPQDTVDLVKSAGNAVGWQRLPLNYIQRPRRPLHINHGRRQATHPQRDSSRRPL